MVTTLRPAVADGIIMILQGFESRQTRAASGQLRAASERLLVGPDNLSRIIAELSQLIVQILDTAFLSHPLGGLGTTYDVHSGLIGKRVVD